MTSLDGPEESARRPITGPPQDPSQESRKAKILLAQTQTVLCCVPDSSWTSSGKASLIAEPAWPTCIKSSIAFLAVSSASHDNY
jgi:hypothetical protein